MISSKLRGGKWPQASEIVEKCAQVVAQMGDWPTESATAESYKRRLSSLQGVKSAESQGRTEMGTVGLNAKLLSSRESKEKGLEEVAEGTMSARTLKGQDSDAPLAIPAEQSVEEHEEPPDLPVGGFLKHPEELVAFPVF